MRVKSNLGALVVAGLVLGAPAALRADQMPCLIKVEGKGWSVFKTSGPDTGKVKMVDGTPEYDGTEFDEEGNYSFMALKKKDSAFVFKEKKDHYAIFYPRRMSADVTLKFVKDGKADGSGSDVWAELTVKGTLISLTESWLTGPTLSSSISTTAQTKKAVVINEKAYAQGLLGNKSVPMVILK